MLKKQADERWPSSPEAKPAFVSPGKNGQPHQSPRRKPLIWIDLDNTPHVIFFEPIIEELRARGFPLTITARDAFQVCDLARKKNIPCRQIGQHYGKNRLLKVSGVFYRALQLAPIALRTKPALSISHGSRSQIVASNLLRIPTLLFADYEFAQYPPLMRPTWEMVPAVIPDETLCCERRRIKKYSGIKEDVYVWKFKPEPRLLPDLGLAESNLIITARPPATEAHYHNPESEGLFTSFMDRACQVENARIVLLPRNQRQGEEIKKLWPRWFDADKTIIPDGAIDGLNLIWHSDLVVGGGGTMNREAAALGVPVYSLFRGNIGAVDRHLEQSGRLILLESQQDVARKIRLEKRPRKANGETASRRSFEEVVNAIAELAENAAA
jgi:predicted glycosyltransferase